MSKHASRPPAARRWAYRPNLENLEVRAQPGSLLFGNLGAGLLGSALDQAAPPPDSGTSDTSLLAARRLTDQNANAVPAVPLSGASASAAPVQGISNLPTSSLPLSPASADAGLPAPSNAAHVVPVGNLAAPVTAQPVAVGNPVAAPAHVPAGDLHPAVTAGTYQYVPPVVPTVTPIQSQAASFSQWSTETINAIGPQVTDNWASFFGGPGPNNALLKVAYTNGTNGMIVAGYTQDPTDATKTDPTVAQINRTGTTATIARYTGLPSGGRGEVHSVAAALDSSGNLTAIYVGGVAGGKAFVASLGPNLGNLTVNWTRVPPSSVTVPSVTNGIALNATGTDLYVTGTVGVSAFAGDLHTADGSTNAYLESISSGAGTTLAGNGIAVDSTGKADIALRAVDATGNPRAKWVQVGATGTVGLINTPSDTEVGDTSEVNDSTFAAGFNAVSVDSAGNAYYSGVSYGSDTSGFSFDIIEKVGPDGNTVLYTNPTTGQPVAWHWFLQNSAMQHIFNWGGFDNKVVNGHQVMATTDDDGSQTLGSHGELLFAVGPNGDVSTDFGDAGLSGANDDYGYGLAEDSFNTNTFYMVGKTNSSDFGTTATFQPTFNGTPPADFNGWVASLAVTP